MRQSFYGRIRAEGYDIGTEQQAMIDFYIDQWQRAGRPTPVLEPMCGTGINLIPFLDVGAEIDGLDASPYMLAICRQKCIAKGLKPHLYQQFLEEMSLPRQYGFILIPGASFGHIYDKTIAQVCVQQLWAHLLPGGWLVLDLRPPECRSEFPQSRQAEFAVEDQADGSTIFSTTIWGDRENGRVLRCWNKYEQYVDGKLMETEVFDYYERFYDSAEFEAMLESAGFINTETTKGWKPAAESGEQDWIVFSCRKP